MSEGYEYSRRITIGGGNGTYFLASPWSSPCEWALVMLSASGAGGVCLTDQDLAAAGISVTATTATSAPATDSGSNSYPGTLMWFTAAQVIVPDAIFTPLTGNRLLLVISGMTSATALATIVFRRQAVIVPTLPALPQVNPDDEALYHQIIARAQMQREKGSEVGQTQYDVLPRSNHHAR